MACSGSIETPTEENPRAQADDDDDAPAAPRPQANNNNTNDDDEEDEPAAPLPVDDEEEDEPAAPLPVDDEEEEEPAAPAGGALSFETDVYPIFTANCAPCHTASALGGQSVGNDDLATALDDAIRIEDKLLSDLSTGRMPSGCNQPPGGGGNCVTEEDFETIEAWYAAGAPE